MGIYFVELGTVLPNVKWNLSEMAAMEVQIQGGFPDTISPFVRGLVSGNYLI